MSKNADLERVWWPQFDDSFVIARGKEAVMDVVTHWSDHVVMAAQYLNWRVVSSLSFAILCQPDVNIPVIGSADNQLVVDPSKAARTSWIDAIHSVTFSFELRISSGHRSLRSRKVVRDERLTQLTAKKSSTFAVKPTTERSFVTPKRVQPSKNEFLLNHMQISFGEILLEK